MGGLIDDLLKLARISRSDMHRERVDLGRMAAEIADELEKSNPGRRVEWHIGTGVMVEGDATLLNILLVNLMGNAWKFTAKNESARIEFGVSGCEVAGFSLREPVIFLRDNGAGFDMKYAAKMFGAFQRLHSAEAFEGSGIGLATVQRIVHRHGGTIRAEGRPDAGAVFYFTLA